MIRPAILSATTGKPYKAFQTKDKMIRPAILNDAAAISDIYNHYVMHTVITFEEIAVTADEMGKRSKRAK